VQLNKLITAAVIKSHLTVTKYNKFTSKMSLHTKFNAIDEPDSLSKIA
jgi:hypothetical protein